MDYSGASQRLAFVLHAIVTESGPQGPRVTYCSATRESPGLDYSPGSPAPRQGGNSPRAILYGQSSPPLLHYLMAFHIRVASHRFTLRCYTQAGSPLYRQGPANPLKGYCRAISNYSGSPDSSASGSRHNLPGNRVKRQTHGHHRSMLGLRLVDRLGFAGTLLKPLLHDHKSGSKLCKYLGNQALLLRFGLFH